MDKKQLLNWLKSYLTDGKTHVIRIFGHGASGKSTLSKDLVNKLNPSHVNLLETDPYILDSKLRQLVRPVDFPEQKITANMPCAHELASLTRDITALKNGIDILTIDQPWAPGIILEAKKPILIAERMSSAFVKAELFDLSIACFTDSETELRRRLKRDTSERGRDKEFVHQSHSIRRQQYQTYFENQLTYADIIIDQSKNSFTAHFRTSK